MCVWYRILQNHSIKVKATVPPLLLPSILPLSTNLHVLSLNFGNKLSYLLSSTIESCFHQSLSHLPCMAPAPLNILIVGCSVAGPTLASLLLLSPVPASEKPHVTILERASVLRTNGQNVDVRGAGVTIVKKLGIENVIRASTTGEEGVQFVDAKNRVWAAFPADKSGRTQTLTSDIEILRGRLGEICWKRSQSVSEEVKREGGAGVEYIFGDYLEELKQDGSKVQVRFAKSGQRRSFDLVVGADGLQSSTRKMVWGAEGEKERVKRLGMYGAFFSMPQGETDSIWLRWFHAPGRRGIMLRPDEQRDRTTAFVHVINEKDQRLVDVAKKGPEGMQAQKELLAEYFRDVGWESERVIREMMATKDFYYDMVAQVKMDKWSKGRVVLLGDAGRVLPPKTLESSLVFEVSANSAKLLWLAPLRHGHNAGPQWCLQLGRCSHALSE